MLSAGFATLGIIAADVAGVPDKLGIITIVGTASGAVGIWARHFYSTRAETIRAQTEQRNAAEKNAADAVAAAITQTAEIHKGQIQILTETYQSQVAFLKEAINYNRERAEKADARADRAEALKENVNEVKHSFRNELQRLQSWVQVLEGLLKDAGGDVPPFKIKTFAELCDSEDKKAQAIVAMPLTDKKI